jgi:phosphatidylserine synthase
MKRIEIKESITRDREILYIVVLTIFIFLQLKKPELWLLIPVAILLFLISLIIKRLFDRQPRLIIDETGIHDKRNQKVYTWENITDIESNFNSSSFKLLVKSKSSIDNIDITTLNTSPKEVGEAIEFFSGNKIRTEKNKFRREIQRILKDNQNIDETMLLFSKQKRKVLWIGLPILFGIPALSIYLQSKLSFPYVFAIGYLVTGIILFAFMQITEKQFKRTTEIQNLTVQEYKDVSIKYELKIPENKRRKLLGYILLTLLTIGVFIVSYIAGR